MRKLFAILVAVLLMATVWAQAPQKMSYQAVVRNSSSAIVANTQIGMEINIRQGSETGTIVYTETHTPTTNANGLVSVEIGAGEGFSTINWTTNTYYIETKTAIVAPLTTYTIIGVSPLLSVPYALNAKTAESISGGITEADPTFTSSQAVNVTATDITKLSNITITGAGTTASPYVLNSIPNLTPTQRDALTASEGLIVYNTNTHRPNYYDGTEWMNFDGTSAKTFVGIVAIGDSYLGGKIAYILRSGDPGYDANVQHGLIAAPSDQSTGIQWYNGSFMSNGTTTVIGSGNANTNNIVANQGLGSYAAKLCADLVLGGYSDWYLPSKDELNKLYLNCAAIGGNVSVNYWSSTENGETYAWYQYFGNGAVSYATKSGSGSVRAVRSF